MAFIERARELGRRDLGIDSVHAIKRFGEDRDSDRPGFDAICHKLVEKAALASCGRTDGELCDQQEHSNAHELPPTKLQLNGFAKNGIPEAIDDKPKPEEPNGWALGDAPFFSIDSA